MRRAHQWVRLVFGDSLGSDEGDDGMTSAHDHEGLAAADSGASIRSDLATKLSYRTSSRSRGPLSGCDVPMRLILVADR